MNLYFLLEGDQTEPKVFPNWIEYILDDYTKVDFFDEAVDNNYYMFSGGGIPSIYNHAINAIKDINSCNLYHKLIVCIDGEEIGIEARKKEIIDKIEESGIVLNEKCQLELIVQEVCIESWLLGNRRFIKQNPQGQRFLDYKKFYDVKIEDPEVMPHHTNFNTKAQFHFSYLKEAFKERNLRYSKSNPKEINHIYFEELSSRTNETNHIQTFRRFRDLLFEIKNKK